MQSNTLPFVMGVRVCEYSERKHLYDNAKLDRMILLCRLTHHCIAIVAMQLVDPSRVCRFSVEIAAFGLVVGFGFNTGSTRHHHYNLHPCVLCRNHPHFRSAAGRLTRVIHVHESTLQ